MSLRSFQEWLRNRPEEVPDATSVAIAIARSGATGVSRDDLVKALRLPPETLENLLRAMVAAGQVTTLKVGGRLTYRAAG